MINRWTRRPPTEPLQDEKGQVRPTWQLWFANQAEQGAGQFAVGDYLQTARTALGDAWLPCDGGEFQTARYPDLETVLAPITAPGGSAGTRKLPGIPVVYDSAHPGPDGPPVMVTYIRAQ